MSSIRRRIMRAVRAVHARQPWRGRLAERINDGDCYEFACAVAARLGLVGSKLRHQQTDAPGSQPEVRWMPDAPHCAIHWNGLWFDAETPEGVPLEEHPFVMRYRRDWATFSKWADPACFRR